MNVRTQDGTLTNMTWWSQMRVDEQDGVTIVLSDVPKAGDQKQEKTLVVARFPGEKEKIQALWTEINAGIKQKRTLFDVPAWEISAVA